MSAKQRTRGHWARLCAALLGREEAAPAGQEGEAELRARAASLEMDLRDRDARIAAMQNEYTHLETAKIRATADAGQSELERLFKRVAGPLSNLATMTALARAGETVASADLLGLIDSLTKELHRAGLEQIGTVGEETVFDTSLHQRMSGGAVHAGSPVIVRVPGFRMSEKILMKAMVSTKEG